MSQKIQRQDFTAYKLELIKYFSFFGVYALWKTSRKYIYKVIGSYVMLI